MGYVAGQKTTRWNRLTGAEEIIKGIRYRVADAALVAHDGHYDIVVGCCDPPAREAWFLFRGIHGHYFTLVLQDWQDETDKLEPCSIGDAMATYRDLEEKVLTWEEAFPGVTVQDA